MDGAEEIRLSLILCPSVVTVSATEVKVAKVLVEPAVEERIGAG